MKIEQYTSKLSEEKIKEAYYEIVDYKRGGFLSKEGVIYKTRIEIKNNEKLNIGVETLLSAFLFEMANRNYKREAIV